MSTVTCTRIGHGGASAIAPANTLASFEAARQIGVDMVEFDVRRWHGELVLAHTILHARRGGTVRLSEALGQLAHRHYDGVELNVDIKHPGCESAVLDGLRDAGLLERALISSQVAAVIDRFRSLEPRARVGISVGGRVARQMCRWGDWRAEVLAGLEARRWETVLVQHRLVDSSLLEAVVERSGRLYAWTVNRRPAIERLRALGVHGIATADPRLFS